MSKIALFLKIIAPVPVLVGVLHLVLGLNADVLLGANVPGQVIADPALDSQNRFYGTAFTLYGVLLFVCATDPRRYSLVLRCLLWIFFAAGIARILSILLYGVPPPLVMALFIIEVVGPPLLLTWLSRAENKG